MSRVAAWVGLVAHLAFLVWYAASGVVAPWWGVAVLIGGWAALLLVAIRLWRWKPAVLLGLPVVDALFWLAVVSAGDAFLGWTA